VLADSGYDDKKIETAIADQGWHFIIALSTARGNYAASSAGCDVPNLASILVFVYVH
jgi:hypothetical protein